jgi:hypothetical protein
MQLSPFTLDGFGEVFTCPANTILKFNLLQTTLASIDPDQGEIKSSFTLESPREVEATATDEFSWIGEFLMRKFLDFDGNPIWLHDELKPNFTRWQYWSYVYNL